MKILHVVGARPNFMKTAPILAAMSEYPDRLQQVLVHTGQHYDANMSRVFFDELELPAPDEFLSVGSGTHAEQTARVMLAFEPVLLKHAPDWVLVVGDVNSTLACALVCSKLGVPVAHVEAGLRSGDRTMPEEINRILTDQISDLLFTPSRECEANLVREGIPRDRIHFVGNVMIDTLVRLRPKAAARPILPTLGLKKKGYALVTLHRPSNVDDPATLREILAALAEIAAEMPIVFPVHPRTRQKIAALQERFASPQLRMIDPLGYLDFLALLDSARLVITDSGGVQEETTYLGIPCLTARPNTERPVTIHSGTNRLVRPRREEIIAAVRAGMGAGGPAAASPELWDGRASRRIAELFLSLGAEQSRAPGDAGDARSRENPLASPASAPAESASRFEAGAP